MRIFVESGEGDFGAGGVEQEAVEVEVEFIISGHDLGDGFDLGEDIEPGPGFHFK